MINSGPPDGRAMMVRGMPTRERLSDEFVNSEEVGDVRCEFGALPPPILEHKGTVQTWDVENGGKLYFDSNAAMVQNPKKTNATEKNLRTL